MRPSPSGANRVSLRLTGFWIRSSSAVLNGFGEVLGGDGVGLVQIGDGARHFENTVVSSGGEAELAHGQLERALAGVVKAAELPQQLRGKLRVGVAALLLARAGGFDALAHGLARSAVSVAAHFLVRHGGHFDVQVDAVQQRPADLAEVALDDRRRAAALARGVAEKPARTSVQVATDTEGRPVVSREFHEAVDGFCAFGTCRASDPVLQVVTDCHRLTAPGPEAAHISQRDPRGGGLKDSLSNTESAPVRSWESE